MQEPPDLFGFPEPEGFGVPSDAEPLFWIKEMRVLSKMNASSDSLIRLVKFRKGLNVVWSIGTESFRNAITHKYVEGVVAAEVRLNGETWSVARPFTAWTSAKGYSQKGVVLDEFLADPTKAGPYDDFKTALETASRKIVPFDKLPDGSPLCLWHYFPWFTRDQEAQFLKLLPLKVKMPGIDSYNTGSGMKIGFSLL